MFVDNNLGKKLSLFALVATLTACGSSSGEDTTAPVISLVGASSINVNHNEAYTDGGATATDDVDGGVTVTTTGSVDTSTVGVYTLTYMATDAAGNEASETRTVNVLDVTAPVITLTGEADITVYQNSTYNDEGATAIDAVDTNVTVNTTGSVDTSTIGVYTLTYTAADAAGNENILTRTVNVVPIMLKGTAAGGAAIVGSVTVKGANGNIKTALIEADGSYEVDVTGLTAPYRLRAEGQVGGKHYKLHSYAEEATIDGTVNITPFTDLIIANTAHQLAENFFDSAIDTDLDEDELAAQEDALQDKLQNIFDALGLDTALDLLNTSFSADHSGLDAALDLISIETGDDNIATITNLLDNTSITDDITDSEDNDTELMVDEEQLNSVVSDTLAIASLFANLTDSFAGGLPTAEAITVNFSADFLNSDTFLTQFLTEITTDPSLINLSFVSVSIEDLDSEAGTATVFFTTALNGIVRMDDFDKWQVIKDDSNSWRIFGNQRIVEIDNLHYHCNDYDGTDAESGACGINTLVEDNDTTNNGSGDAPILSAKVSILDENDEIKDVFYMGTPDGESEIFIYNEELENYTGDWRAFGDTTGEIPASVFAAGDTVQYQLFLDNLDLSSASEPSVTGDVFATYTHRISFAPKEQGLYPIVDDETLANLSDFVVGEDLAVSWQLAEGTLSDSVLVQINDDMGNFIASIEHDAPTLTATSLTLDGSMFDEELPEDYDESAGFMVILRVYAIDSMTGQLHSTDYRQDITPAASLICGYESGWDDDLSEPINPNSFADFQSVVAECGVPVALTKADIAGKTFVENDDEEETKTYNNDGSATKAEPSSGVFNGTNEQIDFNWYIETVDDVTYLVLETGSDIDAGDDFPKGFWLRDTSALSSIVGTKGESGAVYNFITYSEKSNFSDENRASGSDGEIWNTDFDLQ